MLCLFNLVYWNIQDLQVYETLAAICAPAFSPPIMAEHKANIRADICEKCQSRFSSVPCIANLNIAWIAVETHTNTHRKPCAGFCHCRIQNFHIHEQGKEKRKHLHKTASTRSRRSFLLGVLFLQCHCGASKLLRGLNEFLPKWEISRDKKKRRRKGAISPGLF